MVSNSQQYFECPDVQLQLTDLAGDICSCLDLVLKWASTPVPSHHDYVTVGSILSLLAGGAVLGSTIRR
jgi:hypothetical protein